MARTFIERNIFFKECDSLKRTRIRISKPVSLDDALMVCSVSFSKLDKYNATIKGIDEFNAVECAMSYIYAVCRNSEDPEFFFTKTESMKNIDEGDDAH